MNKIDVLAVMDNFIDPQRHPHQPHDLAEARAAVAELIEAARSALQREEFKQGADAGNDGLVRRLRAALARIGGAA